MIKNIAIVSLSRGVAGEAFAQHEVEIGLKRLAGYGVNVQFMPNALRGIDYLTTHPEARLQGHGQYGPCARPARQHAGH